MPFQINLLSHQAKILQNLRDPYLGLICGYGAGKSFTLGHKAAQLLTINRGCDGMVVAPEYPQLRDFILPAVKSALRDIGVKFRYKKNDNLIETAYGNIFLRSATDPSRLAGGNLAWCVWDEVDLLAPDDQRLIWDQLTARLREPKAKLIQFFACSTPDQGESSLLYEKFCITRQAELDSFGKTGYYLVQAKTLDNPYLSHKFIINLFATYGFDPELIDRYINGQFITSKKGRCYYQYCSKYATDEVYHDPDCDTLYIGMDFNVDYSCAVVAEIYGDAGSRELHIVDEITNQKDLVTLCHELKTRYPRHHRQNKIIIVPDCSGANRSYINSDLTAFNVLRDNGFRRIAAPKANIAEFSRILAVNINFNKNRILLSRTKTKALQKDLELVRFDVTGRKVDKKSDKTVSHISDALGYLVTRLLSIRLYAPNSGCSFVAQ